MKYQAGLLGGLFILFTIIKPTYPQSERDIILTPKLALQVKGKTLYYKASDNSERNESSSVPWEQTLKHVTYLTLNSHISDKSANLSELPEYKRFLKSPYIQSNEYIPKFGDIITLARGRLEKVKNGEYRFVEGQCIKRCTEEQQKLIASWIVQKIRHRDADRNFRYEIKFSVSSDVSDKSDSKREIGKRKVRAFVLKDDDYPKNFMYLDHHVAQRRYDEHKSYAERLGRFNQIFSQPRYFHSSERILEYNSAFPDLNTGEYVRDSTSMSPRISVSSNKLIFPTTYRPTYHVKLPKPTYGSPSTAYTKYNLNTFETDDLKSSAPTTHLHHHYYVTKPQLSETNPILHVHKQAVEFPYVKDHRGAIDIIEQPLRSSPNPISAPQNYHTPSPISNQIPVPPNMNTHIQITQTPYSIPITNPIIPAPPVIYMQPIPISHHVPVYVYPRTNVHQSEYVQSTKGFVESVKDEGMRFSEPDPLYHNVNINYDNTFPAQVDHQHVEITSPSGIDNENTAHGYESYGKQSDELPDSINAQLPPPEKDDDLSVPYEETSIVTQTSGTTARLVAPKTSSVENTSSESILATETANEERAIKTSTHEPLNQGILNGASTPETESTGLKIPVIEQQFLIKSSASENESRYLETLTKGYPLTKTSTLAPTHTSIKNNVDKTNVLKGFPIKSHSHVRSTTERPVLKWKPKRTKLNKVTTTIFPSTPTTLANSMKLHEFISPKFNFEAIPVNVTERIITVTPPNNDEVQTKQSVITSISIKVGTEEEERPFIPTITVPNVELYQANLENLGTNSSNIKLYMASDQRRILNGSEIKKENDKKEELELAKSIVEHVQSLR